MILGPISLFDCLVFVLCLAPQLVLQAGVRGTLECLANVLPFLVLDLPRRLLYHDILTPRQHRAPYHQTIPFFTALVVHCVRYAFANLPATIGAIFFSKPVALPFTRWRMLRHGFWPFPRPSRTPPPFASWLGFKHPNVFFEERTVPHAPRNPGGPSGGDGTKGLFIIKDPSRPPDCLIYYLHGGGFAMGSPWFYLEFLLAWVDLLVSPREPPGKGTSDEKQPRKRYANPALFALDYTLVPYATFPTQIEQVLAGYRYVCGLAAATAAPIEVAGDSAGATLSLSLLLHLAQLQQRKPVSIDASTDDEDATPLRHPTHATLISAWCKLISPRNRDTPSDYLNASSLHLYARQYMGAYSDHSTGLSNDRGVEPSIASPSDFQSSEGWRRAVPEGGIHFIHGAEEVLGPETRALMERLEGIRAGCITVTEEEKQIHAWPVVDLFLAGSEGERLRGLRKITGVCKEVLGRAGVEGR